MDKESQKEIINERGLYTWGKERSIYKEMDTQKS